MWGLIGLCCLSPPIGGCGIADALTENRIKSAGKWDGISNCGTTQQEAFKSLVSILAAERGTDRLSKALFPRGTNPARQSQI